MATEGHTPGVPLPPHASERLADELEPAKKKKRHGRGG